MPQPASTSPKWKLQLGASLPCRHVASGALRYVERVIGHRYDDFAPLRTIRDSQVPVLLVHGDADTTVPVSDARQLQDAHPTRTRLVVVPNAGHDDLEALQSVADQVVAFLNESMRSVLP